MVDRMRLQLNFLSAAALFAQQDLALLDELANYLDFKIREALGDVLNNY